MTDDEFDEFFRATYPRLVAVGLAMSTPRHVAQELAQETMLRAYRHADELDGYQSPSAWCRRVMGNLLIDQHRTRTAERSAVERMQARTGVDPHVVGVDPAEVAAAPRWDDLVADLSPRQRLAATLYYAHDQSVDAVAGEMGIAAGTVKSALSKARRNVRRAIGGHEHRGDDEQEARS